MPAKKTKWTEADLCPECGEGAHVTFCPKPPSIPKDQWQKMSDDERIAAEQAQLTIERSVDAAYKATDAAPADLAELRRRYAELSLDKHNIEEEMAELDVEIKSEEGKERLEYLRGELKAERISYMELVELQSLAASIAPDDVELLEAAGVPEFPLECDGHPAGPFDQMGETVYCDGSCKKAPKPLRPPIKSKE